MSQKIRFFDLKLMELKSIDLTENKLNQLDPKLRLAICIHKIKNKNSSVSQRWDCLVIISELYVKIQQESLADIPALQSKKILVQIEDILQWMIYNESNCVVHHEVAYQIAARNIRRLVPDMIWSAINSKSIVSRHEYIECLGVMKAFDALDGILDTILYDKNSDIKETAEFVLDRTKRYSNEKEWVALDIV